MKFDSIWTYRSENIFYERKAIPDEIRHRAQEIVEIILKASPVANHRLKKETGSIED